MTLLANIPKEMPLMAVLFRPACLDCLIVLLVELVGENNGHVSKARRRSERQVVKSGMNKAYAR